MIIKLHFTIIQHGMVLLGRDATNRRHDHCKVTWMPQKHCLVRLLKSLRLAEWCHAKYQDKWGLLFIDILREKKVIYLVGIVFI